MFVIKLDNKHTTPVLKNSTSKYDKTKAPASAQKLTISRCDILGAFFANRVIGLYNSLLDDIVYSAISINGFMIKITKHFSCCVLRVLIFKS